MAKDGVPVNAVNPGFTRTGVTEDMLKNAPVDLLIFLYLAGILESALFSAAETYAVKTGVLMRCMLSPTTACFSLNLPKYLEFRPSDASDFSSSDVKL